MENQAISRSNEPYEQYVESNLWPSPGEWSNDLTVMMVGRWTFFRILCQFSCRFILMADSVMLWSPRSIINILRYMYSITKKVKKKYDTVYRKGTL